MLVQKMISQATLVTMKIEMNGMLRHDANLVADSQTDWQELLTGGRSLASQVKKLKEIECDHAFLMVSQNSN